MPSPPGTIYFIDSLFKQGVMTNAEVQQRLVDTEFSASNNTIASYRALFKRLGDNWIEENRKANREWAKANPDKRRAMGERWRTERNPAQALLGQAVQRAKRDGRVCTISVEEITQLLAPMTCSVTCLPLTWVKEGSSHKNPWAPSLDRIDNQQGYVSGNVRVVCWLYNSLKNDYSSADIQRLIIALRTCPLETAW